MGPLILGWICLALVSLVSGYCPDKCSDGFGDPGGNLRATETGIFRNDMDRWIKLNKTVFTEKPTIHSGELKEYFEVIDGGSTWVLEVMDQHIYLSLYRSLSG